MICQKCLKDKPVSKFEINLGVKFDSVCSDCQAKKVCSKCKSEKILRYFGRNARLKSGYKNQCKSCEKAGITAKKFGAVETSSSVKSRRAMEELIEENIINQEIYGL